MNLSSSNPSFSNSWQYALTLTDFKLHFRPAFVIKCNNDLRIAPHHYRIHCVIKINMAFFIICKIKKVKVLFGSYLSKF